MNIFVISRGIPSEKYPTYGIFEFDQARALAGNGENVTMLVIDFRSLQYKRKYGLSVYSKEGVKVFELSLPLGAYRRGMPVLQFFMYALFRKTTEKVGFPDVIHAHFYSIAAIAGIIHEKTGVPLVVTEHSSKLNADRVSKIDMRLATKAYRGAAAVIAVSESLCGSLTKHFGIRPVVVHDCIDPSLFPLVDRGGDVHDACFRFLSVGHLIHRKGHDLLIRSFIKAFPPDASVCLDIVGEGEQREMLQGLVDAEGRGHQIRLAGPKTRDGIYSMMKRSEAFVLASRGETFGVSYLEAMSAGLPVIATRCGGPENFVTEETGILVKKDDIRALSVALQEMYRHAREYDSAVINGYYRENFSTQSIARQIIGVFHDVLRQR